MAYGNVTEYTYDDAGRILSRKLPNEAETTAEYNLEECYTIVTDEKGIQTKNIYDDFGRITQQQQKNVQLGIDWYNGKDIQVRFSAT